MAESGRVVAETIRGLGFIEAGGFQRKFRASGLNDDDLRALQQAIIENPKGAPVMKGTGGVRKMRFSGVRSRQGKSGAYRVGYVYVEEFGIIGLFVLFPKNEKANLTKAEAAAVKTEADWFRKWIAGGMK